MKKILNSLGFFEEKIIIQKISGYAAELHARKNTPATKNIFP
jgi:hypothetical protein